MDTQWVCRACKKNLICTCPCPGATSRPYFQGSCPMVIAFICSEETFGPRSRHWKKGNLPFVVVVCYLEFSYLRVPTEHGLPYLAPKMGLPSYSQGSLYKLTGIKWVDRDLVTGNKLELEPSGPGVATRTTSIRFKMHALSYHGYHIVLAQEYPLAQVYTIERTPTTCRRPSRKIGTHT